MASSYSVSANSERDAIRRITDRVAATPDNELENILEKLIPKVLPMANNFDLQESILNLVSQILRRVKPLKTLLPCSVVIDQIIRPEMLPLSCNLGIAFVDIGLALEMGSRREDCAKAILKSMELYINDPYCVQMQALFGYLVHVLDFVPVALKFTHISTPLNLLVGDFLVDISLLRQNLSGGTVGSVLPGLSEPRVKRLLLKRDIWGPQGDVTSLKHRLLACMGEIGAHKSDIGESLHMAQTQKHYFPAELAHAVTISIILQYDSDSELSRQATFKLNGCRTILRNSYGKAGDTNSNSEVDSAVSITLRQLFSFALGPENHLFPLATGVSSTRTASTMLYELNFQFGKRLPLNPDIRAAILRWIAKDASEYLPDVAPECLECVFSNILLISPVDGSKTIAVDVSDTLKLACVTILQKALSLLGDSSLAELCSDSDTADFYCSLKSDDLISVCMGLLPGLGQLSLHSDDCQIDIRKTVYMVLTRLCQVFPKAVTKDASVLRTLFALMELEDERIITHLLTAIAALKTAFEQSDYVTNGIQQTGGLLESLLTRARASPSAKQRVVALQWSRSLFKWSPFTIRSMIALCSDATEIVFDAALSELKALRSYFKLASPHKQSRTQHFSPLETGDLLGDKFIVLTALVSELPSIMSTVAAEKISITTHEGSARTLNEVLLCITAGLSCFVSTISLSGAPTQSPHNDDTRPNADFKQIYLSNSWDDRENEVHELFWSCSTWATTPWISYETASALYPDSFRFLQSIALDVILVTMMTDEARVIFFKLVSNGIHDTSVNGEGLLTNSIMVNLLNLFKFGLEFWDHSAVVNDVLSVSRVLMGILSYSTENNQEILAQCLALLGVCNGDPVIGISIRAIDGAYFQNLFRLLCHKYESSCQTNIEDSAMSSCFGAGGALRTMGCIAELVYCYAQSGSTDLSSKDIQLCGELCKDILNFIYRAMDNVKSFKELAKNYIYYATFSVISNLSSRGVLVFPAIADESYSAPSSLFDRLINQYLCDTGTTSNILSFLMQLIRDHGQEKEAKLSVIENQESILANKLKLLDPRTYAIAIYAVGNIAWNIRRRTVPSNYQASAESLWIELFSMRFLNTNHTVVRFALAECLCKLLFVSSDHVENSVNRLPSPSSLESFLVFAEQLAFLENTAEGTVAETLKINNNAKGTIAVITLVFLKQVRDSDNYSDMTIFFPFSALKRCAVILLKLLGTLEKLTVDRNPFIQDICCSGLCYCYDMADSIERKEGILSSDRTNGKSYREVIADLVIYTITRDKKMPLPPGMATAGERNTTNGDGTTAENGAESPDQQDALVAAAEAAAAELGLSMADVSFLRQGTSRTPAESLSLTGLQRGNAAASEGDFGVYTKACKIARKSGDNAVVFAVLASIQRDPLLVSKLGESEFLGNFERLFLKYKPPAAKTNRSKLKALVPALYVSKFDPSAQIRDVLKLLWEKLLEQEDKAALLAANSYGIIKFALSQMASRAWRDRETGCIAMEAFVSRRPWVEIFPHLSELWFAGMQVLDDVRDSTRAAAIGFTKVLSQQIIRACTPEDVHNSNYHRSEAAVSDSMRSPDFLNSKEGNDSSQPNPVLRWKSSNKQNKIQKSNGIDDTAEIIIPILLDSGLVAASAEGRGFSLGVLIQLVKLAKYALKMHLVRITSVLIESMSALEPQTLQYMQFHTARLNISEQELEEMRLKLSSHSPMQEALDICLQSLTPITIPPVVYQLCGQLKGGVGLPTRVSAVKSLSYLLESYFAEFSQTAMSAVCTYIFNSLLNVLLHTDISSVGLKNFMLSCLGSVSLVVDGDTLCSVCLELANKYEIEFSVKYEGTEAVIIGECLSHIIKRGGERIEDERTWHSVIACAYIGSHHSEESIKSPWMTVWTEALAFSGLGDKYSALLKILPRVCDSVVSLLSSLSWLARIVGLSVLNDVTMLIPLCEIVLHIPSVLLALFNCVKLRIWKMENSSGQGDVLEIIAAIFERYSSLYDYSFGSTECNDEKLISNDEISLPDRDVADCYLNISLLLKFAEEIPKETSNKRKFETPYPESSGRNLRELRVSAVGIIDMLLTEAQRGDKVYKFKAIKALSTMRSSWLYISINRPDLFLRITDTLSKLAAIPDDITVAYNNAGDIGDVKQSKIEERGSIPTNMSVSAQLKSSSANRVAARSSKTSVVGGSTSSMFGNRYSRSLPAAGNKVASKSSQVAQLKSSQVQTPHESSAGSLIPETVVHGSSIDVAPENVIIITESIEESIESSTTKDESKPQFGESQNEPAFRVKVLECFAYGWPYDGKELIGEFNNQSQVIQLCDSFKSDSNLCPLRAKLIRWILKSSQQEIWSIKRQMILLLGVLISRCSCNLGEIENAINFLVDSYSGNSKHAPVREAVLSCLKMILGSIDAKVIAMLKANCAPSIRLLSVSAASDTSTGVLEELQQVKNLWSSIHSV